jgi:hypothetical protein
MYCDQISIMAVMESKLRAALTCVLGDCVQPYFPPVLIRFDRKEDWSRTDICRPPWENNPRSFPSMIPRTRLSRELDASRQPSLVHPLVHKFHATQRSDI